MTTLILKWLYSEDTKEIEERLNLIVEEEGPLYFCSNSLQWEMPSKHPQTVSSWTPHYLYFFRQGLWWFLDLSDADSYDIAQDKGVVRINIVFDSQARHPFLKLQNKKWLFSGNGLRQNGEVYSYQICLYPLSSKKPTVPIINRFPEDYQAAFCITDHADYDQVGPLKAVFLGDSSPYKKERRGLAGSGLRITKSVFARSFPEYRGAGLLDDPELKNLINHTYDFGNEIVPHGIRSFPGTSKELATDFKEAFYTYKPKTWIDHFYSFSTLLPHSLANDGLKPSSPHYIWPLLQDEGVDLVWSGLDNHHNPPQGKLNLLDLTDNRPNFYFLRAMKSMLSAHLKEAGYYGLELVEALVGYETRLRFKKAFQILRSKNDLGQALEGFSKIISNIIVSSFQGKGRKKIEKNHGIQLFSMQNRFPGNDTVGTFYTMRLNQLGKGLAPERWKKVFQDRGVVLLHTYLACDHPLGDNAWKRVGSEYRITPDFDRVTEFLGEKVSQKKLWNPTVHEMWEWYKEWKKVRVVPDQKNGSWKVLNWPQMSFHC